MPRTDRAAPAASLEPIERASRDEIVALQTERLAKTLRYVYDHVDVYRRSFDSHGVRPEDFSELSDLSRFPTTAKADLREAYPFGMLAVPRESLERVHASSGTTGKPTVVGYTRNDLDVWANVMERSIRAAGGRSTDLIHNAYGYGLFTGGLGVHDGAEKMGCTVVPVSGGMTERQVTLIKDFDAQLITATPSYMLAIADEFDRQGVDSRSTSLEVGIFGAEPWTEGMREEIESRFDLHAVNIYGLSEIIGPGVASECVETKDGLTVWEDHFYPEIVDPKTTEPLADGEEGELVFTTLTKTGMPLIRYRTRDLTRLMPPTARSMRRIDRISGRTDDMMIIRGVNVFPSQIEEQILNVPELSPHYVLELTRQGPLDSLKVIVEARSSDASGDTKKNAEAALGAKIKSVVGVTAAVEVASVGTVDRSMGKAVRTRDLR